MEEGKAALSHNRPTTEEQIIPESPPTIEEEGITTLAASLPTNNPQARETKRMRAVILMGLLITALLANRFVKYVDTVLSALVVATCAIGILLPCLLPKKFRPSQPSFNSSSPDENNAGHDHQQQVNAEMVLRDIEDGKPPATATELVSSSALPTSNQKLVYLDTIKIVLTVAVIVFHAMAGFTGAAGPNVPFQIGNYFHPFQVFSVSLYILGQSCGLSCFFFISGYFTPGSLQRKGPWIFINDKLTRLGIPFLVHIVVFGFVSKVLNPDSDQLFPFPIAGVTWFLAWLIILNLAYVYRVRGIAFPKIGTEPHKAPPPFTRLYAIGLLAGLLNGAIMTLNKADVVFNGGSAFITMPTSFGSLPFYILFFEAGILAKRQAWLTHFLPAISKQQRVVASVLTAALIVFVFLQLTMIYVFGGGGWSYIPTIAGEDPSLGRAPTEPLVSESAGRQPSEEDQTMCTLLVVATSTIMGVFCVAFNVVLFDCARRRGNSETKFTMFLGKLAYIAYLIQAPIVIGFTKLYSILLGVAGYEIFTREGSTVSSTRVPLVLLVVGWFFVSTCSLAVSFGVGALIRRIPGCSKII